MSKSRIAKMTYMIKHLYYVLINITYANSSLCTVKQSVPVTIISTVLPFHFTQYWSHSGHKIHA